MNIRNDSFAQNNAYALESTNEHRAISYCETSRDLVRLRIIFLILNKLILFALRSLIDPYVVYDLFSPHIAIVAIDNMDFLPSPPKRWKMALGVGLGIFALRELTFPMREKSLKGKVVVVTGGAFFAFRFRGGDAYPRYFYVKYDEIISFLCFIHS